MVLHLLFKGISSMKFKDFKFSNEPEEEWKIKFKEDVRKRNIGKKQLPDFFEGVVPFVYENFDPRYKERRDEYYNDNYK